jgi:hypothetical protein
MGHMDVISFISDGFNIYFPILIIVLCLANFFHLGGRVLHFFGFEQFIGDNELTQDLVEDGKNLVKRGIVRMNSLKFCLLDLDMKAFIFVKKNANWNETTRTHGADAAI